LVHDAARPCLRGSDLALLIERLSVHAVGGLLGRPVHDTMKRADPDGRVETTVPRDNLWHAYTPQMFRLGVLHQALERALAEGRLVTDEASAMELAGQRPQLVEGAGDNLKITRPEDLALADFYLSQQREG
jgi:2-C-methyl-D-erythritol 4-phosphate cytidylyltransferase